MKKDSMNDAAKYLLTSIGERAPNYIDEVLYYLLYI